MWKLTVIILTSVVTGYIISGMYTVEANPKLIYSPTIPTIGEKVVCIVFDDGWKSQVNAVAILDRYDFKATFGIITKYADKGYPAYMTWSEIQAISKDGMDIESHSYSHGNMNNMSMEGLIQETDGSRKDLASHGFFSNIFIYPFGEGYDNKTVRDVVSSSYLVARARVGNTYNIITGDRYAITSCVVANDTSMTAFMLYLKEVKGSNIVILVYHQIGDGKVSTSITSEQFDSQMSYLKNNGYTVMTMKDVFLKMAE